LPATLQIYLLSVKQNKAKKASNGLLAFRAHVISGSKGCPCLKYVCKNCNLRFEADDAVICPRCSSKNLDKAFDKKKDGVEAEKQPEGPKVAYSTNRHVYSETKAGWASFHSSEMRACPDCGGLEFDFNWKRKEKTCKKCGSVFPLGRRTA